LTHSARGRQWRLLAHCRRPLGAPGLSGAGASRPSRIDCRGREPMAARACVGDDMNGIAGDRDVALPAVSEDIGAQGQVEARIGRAVLVERVVGGGVKNMQIITRPAAAAARSHTSIRGGLSIAA